MATKNAKNSVSLIRKKQSTKFKIILVLCKIFQYFKNNMLSNNIINVYSASLGCFPRRKKDYSICVPNINIKYRFSLPSIDKRWLCSNM